MTAKELRRQAKTLGIDLAGVDLRKRGAKEALKKQIEEANSSNPKATPTPKANSATEYTRSPALERLAAECQKMEAIEKLAEIRQQKPSKARHKREGQVLHELTLANKAILHCLYPKLKTYEYTLQDYIAIADSLEHTEMTVALRACFFDYEIVSLERKLTESPNNLVAEIRKLRGQLKEVADYIDAVGKRLNHTIYTEVAEYTLQVTKENHDAPLPHYSFRVKLAPGIYSRSYNTADAYLQFAEDFPQIAEEMAKEGYLSLPRVVLGGEALVKLPTGGTVREVGGLIDLGSLEGALK